MRALYLGARSRTTRLGMGARKRMPRRLSRLLVCAIGTRPEALLVCRLISRLRLERPALEVRVLTTGQHRGLLDQALADFSIVPDHDLGLMRPDQGLADLTARALTGVSGYLERVRPDLV